MFNDKIWLIPPNIEVFLLRILESKFSYGKLRGTINKRNLRKFKKFNLDYFDRQINSATVRGPFVFLVKSVITKTTFLGDIYVPHCLT